MFRVYCNDKIIVKRGVYNQWGTLTNISNIAVSGRVDFKSKLVRNIQGEQVVSTAEVTIPLMNITHKDKIVFNNFEYSIINIAIKKDFTNKYVKLYIG